MFRRRTLRLVLLATLVASALAFLASSSTSAARATCAESGVGCEVGMIGPRGGIVFYDAGSMQWWGRFLEAERETVRARATWGEPASIYPGTELERRLRQRHAMSIGMGRWNTRAMLAAGSPLALRHVPAGQDWFLPSKDELDALYDFWRLRRVRPMPYGMSPVWTSTESEDAYAWYQLFHDGTQFTDANGIISGLASNKGYVRSPRHSGSGFASAPMHVVRVRAFPPPLSEPGPPPPFVTVPTDNPSCATNAIGCRIGDVGPGGGIVVYDAGTAQPWGRYLEVAPKACEIVGAPYADNFGRVLVAFKTPIDRIVSKAIGAGAANTAKLVRVAGTGSAAALADASTCGGRTDWFLPSKGELNEAFRRLSHSRTGLQPTPVGQFERGYYWTSSDYDGRTAWTQYFADGQQFDRIQTLKGNRKPPSRPFLARPMRAFQEGVPG